MSENGSRQDLFRVLRWAYIWLPLANTVVQIVYVIVMLNFSERQGSVIAQIYNLTLSSGFTVSHVLDSQLPRLFFMSLWQRYFSFVLLTLPAPIVQFAILTRKPVKAAYNKWIALICFALGTLIHHYMLAPILDPKSGPGDLLVQAPEYATMFFAFLACLSVVSFRSATRKGRWLEEEEPRERPRPPMAQGMHGASGATQRLRLSDSFQNGGASLQGDDPAGMIISGSGHFGPRTGEFAPPTPPAQPAPPAPYTAQQGEPSPVVPAAAVFHGASSAPPTAPATAPGEALLPPLPTVAPTPPVTAAPPHVLAPNSEPSATPTPIPSVPVATLVPPQNNAPPVLSHDLASLLGTMPESAPARVQGNSPAEIEFRSFMEQVMSASEALNPKEDVLGTLEDLLAARSLRPDDTTEPESVAHEADRLLLDDDIETDEEQDAVEEQEQPDVVDGCIICGTSDDRGSYLPALAGVKIHKSCYDEARAKVAALRTEEEAKDFFASSPNLLKALFLMGSTGPERAKSHKKRTRKNTKH